LRTDGANISIAGSRHQRQVLQLVRRCM